MRYLIDTNILIFSIREKDRISKDILDIIEDNSNLIYVSSRSIEEIVHLLRIGKVEVKQWKKRHNDPVDHAILAHAIANKITLISSDKKMRFYADQGLSFIWNGA